MITAIFTSCGRFDLLEKTIVSFVKYSDISVEKIIIIDNSVNPYTDAIIDDMVKRNRLESVYLITNEENIGQVSSIDVAYSFVDTEYIFHCEDDWEFFDTGFMELSKKLLEDRSDIINVNLRVRFDGEKGSMHPITEIYTSKNNVRYHEYIIGYLGAWHGFSWNPGLRRLSDYNKIKPYKQHGEESKVGLLYKNMGYVSACLEKSYCKHIGTYSTTPKSNQ